MKKTLFAALLLLGMSIMFASCEKTRTSGNVKKDLIGCWAGNYDDGPEGSFFDWNINYYIEFKKDGHYTEYMLFPDDANATFDEQGVLRIPSSAKWEVMYSGKYSVGGKAGESDTDGIVGQYWAKGPSTDYYLNLGGQKNELTFINTKCGPVIFLYIPERVVCPVKKSGNNFILQLDFNKF